MTVLLESSDSSPGLNDSRAGAGLPPSPDRLPGNAPARVQDRLGSQPGAGPGTWPL